MKKFVFFCFFIVTFLFVSCSIGGDKEDEASSEANYPCSFTLYPPIDYDTVTGVALSGIIYRDNKPEATTLWVGKELYNKMIIKGNDGLNVRILKGKCISVFPPLRSRSYIVYFVE